MAEELKFGAVIEIKRVEITPRTLNEVARTIEKGIPPIKLKIDADFIAKQVSAAVNRGMIGGGSGGGGGAAGLLLGAAVGGAIGGSGHTVINRLDNGLTPVRTAAPSGSGGFYRGYNPNVRRSISSSLGSSPLLAGSAIFGPPAGSAIETTPSPGDIVVDGPLVRSRPGGGGGGTLPPAGSPQRGNPFRGTIIEARRLWGFANKPIPGARMIGLGIAAGVGVGNAFASFNQAEGANIIGNGGMDASASYDNAMGLSDSLNTLTLGTGNLVDYATGDRRGAAMRTRALANLQDSKTAQRRNRFNVMTQGRLAIESGQRQAGVLSSQSLAIGSVDPLAQAQPQIAQIRASSSDQISALEAERDAALAENGSMAGATTAQRDLYKQQVATRISGIRTNAISQERNTLADAGIATRRRNTALTNAAAIGTTATTGEIQGLQNRRTASAESAVKAAFEQANENYRLATEGTTDPEVIKAAQTTRSNERRLLEARQTRIQADFRMERTNIMGSAAINTNAMTGNRFGAASQQNLLDFGNNVYQNPEQAPAFLKQYNTAERGTRFEKALFNFGQNSISESLNRGAARQRLANKGQFSSAEAQGVIDETSDAIRQANVELRGDENKDAREKRVMALRNSAKARLEGIQEQLLFGNSAAQVSGYTFSGDRNNQRSTDLDQASRIIRGADRQFNDTAKGSDVTPKGTTGSDAQADEMVRLLRLIEQKLGTVQ